MNIDRELEKEIAKQSKIRMAHMQRYLDHSATRARTTTANANADRCQDRIIELQEQIKARDAKVARNQHTQGASHGR